MKPKQIVLLLIILLLLGALIFIKNANHAKSIEKEVEPKLNLVTDLTKIQKVEFSKDEKNKIELVRQDGEWRIPELWNDVLGTVEFALGNGLSDRHLTFSGSIADYI